MINKSFWVGISILVLLLSGCGGRNIDYDRRFKGDSPSVAKPSSNDRILEIGTALRKHSGDCRAQVCLVGFMFQIVDPERSRRQEEYVELLLKDGRVMDPESMKEVGSFKLDSSGELNLETAFPNEPVEVFQLEDRRLSVRLRISDYGAFRQDSDKPSIGGILMEIQNVEFNFTSDQYARASVYLVTKGHLALDRSYGRVLTGARCQSPSSYFHSIGWISVQSVVPSFEGPSENQVFLRCNAGSKSDSLEFNSWDDNRGSSRVDIFVVRPLGSH